MSIIQGKEAALMKNRKQIATRIVFTAYSVLLMYFLFFNGRHNYNDYSFAEYALRNTNFIPFHNILGSLGDLIAGNKLRYVAVNLAGNVLIFVPLGALLPLNFKKLVSFGKYIVTAVLIPLVIEGIQLIFMVGCFDVDDIILNTIGLLIGYGFYLFLKRRKEKG